MQSFAQTLCSTGLPPVSALKTSTISNSRNHVLPFKRRISCVTFYADDRKKRRNITFSDKCSLRLSYRQKLISGTTAATSGGGDSISELDDDVRKLLQIFLWIAEGVYIIWLFLLPCAPGDPLWAISSETINSLIGLSLNFFFILPLSNSVGIHLIEAPDLHPMSEGLFNFVIGWTLMFAPLLYTDKFRDRYKGSLDVLWGFQMFLTNTFLIPYMAIRLNKADGEYTPRKTSQLGLVMTKGAPFVGLIGASVSFISILWGLYGRGDGNYGDLHERWSFLVSYLGSERLAYAFIWDICLYTIFQPWLIGDNLPNIRKDKIALVRALRFIPVVGMIAYCLCLDDDREII